MKKKDQIEFVSYSGKYPCLCYGKLVVRINGKYYSFNGKYNSEKISKKNNELPSLWISGGRVDFEDDYSDYTIKNGDWTLSEYLDKDDFPEIVWKNRLGIIDVMNQNVPKGCCGGCV